MKTPLWRMVLAYAAAAVLVTWPVIARPWSLVPGAERSDLWNSLWSLWFFQRSLWHGDLPVSCELLGFPQGGSLMVADPLSALLATPLVPLLGLTASYTLLVLLQLVFSGCAAHRLAELLWPAVAKHGAAWVAGLGYLAAPVLVSAIHNGTSESMAGGWLPLAVAASIGALRRGGLARLLAAACALAVAAVASWYGGVCAFCAISLLALTGEGRASIAVRLARLGPVLLLGAAMAAPLALSFSRVSTGESNLVGIKSEKELAQVRRSTGPADPVGWFAPGDFRSPDFRLLSRYGEDFVHAHYLGWLLLLAALACLGDAERRKGSAWLFLAALIGALLAMGPVAARHGQPLIVAGTRAIPLPYLLLENLPGFSSLSLLYRLAQLPALCFALLAARGVAGRTRRPAVLGMLLALAVFAELRLVSPTRGLPAVADATPAPPISALALAPAGAVMNFPVVGGRRYLYEQTVHGKPLAGALNFPNNGASRRVWKAILENMDRTGQDPTPLRQALRTAACDVGIRYLVVHVDPMARPDMHDQAVRALKQIMVPLDSVPALRVYDLCDPSLSQTEPGPTG